MKKFTSILKKIFLSDIAKLCFSLFLTAAITALLLGGTNMLTSDKIAQNDAETQLMMIREIYPYDSLFGTQTNEDGLEYIVARGEKNLPIGYAVNVSSQGYGGEISMLVCFDTKGTLLGVGIVSLSETQGVGTRVTSVEFLAQFEGKTAPLKLVTTTPSEKSHIAVISGATISSRAVVSGVNKASVLLEEYFEV